MIQEQNDVLIKKLEKLQVSFSEDEAQRLRLISRTPAEPAGAINISTFSKGTSHSNKTTETRKALEPPRIQVSRHLERVVLINEATQTVHENQTH